MAHVAVTWPSSHPTVGTEAQRTHTSAGTVTAAIDSVFCQHALN